MSLVWSPDYNPPAQGHLIYTIDTTTGGTTPSNVDFNLRSTGAVDYRVVWETSVEETSTSNTLLHTYGSAGTYDVQVFPTGTYRPYFNNVTADVDQITKVSVGGAVGLGTDLGNAWFGADRMTEFECNFNATSSVTDFSFAWDTCNNLTNFPLIDTSSATNFRFVWRNCTSLTNFPEINTSSGIDFSSTWNNCTSLTSFPRIDTSSGTNFNRTWQDCTSLTSFPEINTSSGTSFFYAWIGCNSLTDFPEINTSSATNFTGTWFNCSSLTDFPRIDTSSGTNFAIAWSNCTSLTNFPEINTSSGTNFDGTWSNCTSLTSFPRIDTSSGTNFNQTWRNCSSLTSFPTNFFDSWTGTPVSNCFGNAWDNCTSLTATSVENILNSIDTSGQSAPASGVDITISYNAASGTPNITTAVSNLKSRGWTITLNGVAQ